MPTSSLTRLRRRIAQLETAEREARPAVGAARAALDAATHQLRHAEAEYDAAVEDTAATQLAAGLKIGEPCPVCDQIVTKKPKVRAGEKDRARKARDAARKKGVAAREKLDKLVKGAGDSLPRSRR